MQKNHNIFHFCHVTKAQSSMLPKLSDNSKGSLDLNYQYTGIYDESIGIAESFKEK